MFSVITASLISEPSSTSLSRRRPLWSAALIVSALVVAGCEEKKEPPQSETVAASAKPAATTAQANPHAAGNARSPHAAPKRAKQKDILTWDDPKGLTKVKPKNSFRKASYELPQAGDEKQVGIMNVFAFGGDVESNMERWKGQFKNADPKSIERSDRSVNDLTQSIIYIPKGDYDGGMSPEEGGKDFALLAALVPAPNKQLYIFKMTGPSEAVAKAKPAFYAMMDSVRLNEPKADEAQPAADGESKTKSPH